MLSHSTKQKYVCDAWDYTRFWYNLQEWKLSQVTTKPTVWPEAQETLPLLSDFPALYPPTTPNEQRAILKGLFAELYFDGEAKARQARPYAPFASSL